ncbi:MAG: hypothetical protein HRU12_08865 [Phaeodactylibacter sp.]|nr:hypothetical protein [Phaeodactylibacter sp.]
MDDRIAAVLDIDGTPPTKAFEDVLEVPFMFIEDLIDYKNHSGYQKVHRRRARFCNSNKADAYRVMIGETKHNSFLDIHYHLAEQMEAKRSALNILNQTANYAHQFFDYGLKGLAMDLPEIQTDTLEIIRYPAE